MACIIDRLSRSIATWAAAWQRGASIAVGTVAATLMFGAMAPLSAADVQYVYDRDGRLVTVIAPNGDSARYNYDPAGNIKSIQRYAAGALWVGDFSPAAGPSGTSVTIRGGGFSATPANNTVKFNGTVATVTAAAANQLTATVPAAATSGPISVTVGGTTVASAASFTVGNTGAGAPSITGFTPTEGAPGTVVTITGSRFDPDRANNFVTLAGRATPVTSATAAQLQVTIPPDAQSGRFTVKTPQGNATSSGDFYVAPSGINAADIVQRLRAGVDGAPLQINALPAGKYAQVLFDGTAGQYIGIGGVPITSSPSGGYVSIAIRKPDGSQLTVCNAFYASNNAGACSLPQLPKTGTYQALVWAGGADMSVALTLSTDASGTLTKSQTTTFSTTRYGQNARYTFTAEAGKSYSVVPSDVTLPTTWANAYVYAPNGTVVASANLAQGYAPAPMDVPAAVAGTYTVTVDPYLAEIGQVKLTLREALGGSISVGGAVKNVNLASGQNAVYTFNGTAGKTMGLGISNVTTVPAGGNVHVAIYGPTGALVANCPAVSSSGDCDIPALPTTGTYTLKVDTDSNMAATLTLTLSNDVTGKLTVNAPAPTVFATTRSGQNARYTFAGKAGKNYSIALTGGTFVGYWTYVTVYAPDGTQVAQSYSNAGIDSSPVDINNAPATGDYAVFVNPYQGGTGQVSLGLREAAGGALAIDGTPTAATLANGQNGRYSFTGTAGQTLGLGITNVSTVPAGGYAQVRLYGTTGALVVDCGNVSAADECNFPPLPASGSYVVQVDPAGSGSASMTLTLSTDLTADLALDAATATSFNTARAGQNGRYTFTGVAGQSYSIAFDDITIPGTWTYIYVYGPTGTQLASGYVGQGYAPTPIDLLNVPVNGTYSVFIDPYLGNTGRVKLALRSLASGTLTIDGAPTAIDLLDGQNGRYTFTGTAGQHLGLGVSALKTTPTGANVYFRVYGPSGAQLTDCSYASGANTECDLPPLPVDGTYAVVVDTQGVNAAKLTLTLSNDAAGTLGINAATPKTFNATRFGENARYTFSGTAGKHYSVAVSDCTFVGTWTYAYVYAPDGAQLGYTYCQQGSDASTIELPAVTASGTYTVFVDPYLGLKGQVKIGVREAATGLLAIDGAPTAVNLLGGQNGRYTFSGTAGQQLGLGIDSIATVPAGGTVAFALYGPTGAAIVDCSNTTGPVSECDFPPLPSTGTYTVVVDPRNANTASMNLTLSTDVTGTLVVNSVTPTAFTTSRAGQNGRYTFAGTAGKNYSIAVTDTTFVGFWTYVTVLAPDGSQLSSTYAAAGNNPSPMLINNVAANGDYTVLVDPYMAATGQLKLQVIQTGTTDPTPQSPNGSLSVDGAPLAFNVPASQIYLYTFSGNAGQRLSLGITGVTTSPPGQSVHVWVKRTDNSTTLTECSWISTPTSCSIAPLPATGTYTIAVQPGGGAGSTGTLTLSTDVAGTLTANAAPTVFAATRAGQRSRYTFSGQAGKSYNITASDSTFPGSWSYVYVYAPNGTQLAYTYVSGSSSAAPANLPNVTATGTYTVVAVPDQAGTGQMNLALRSPATATLAVDGAPINATLLAGQDANYTFTGSTGQRLALGVTALTTTPANNSVYVKLYAPNGALLHDCGGYSSNGDCDFPRLPSNGTYKLTVQSYSGVPANLTLTLSTDIPANLAVNAAVPTQFLTARAGQDGRYTFNGTVGKSYSLALTDATVAGYVYVFAADGSSLGNVSVSAGASGLALHLNPLVAGGTMTVWFDPNYAATGELKIALRETSTGAMAVNGATLPVSLLSAQRGRYTFNGTAGQSLGLGLVSTTVAPNNAAYYRVYAPSGALLVDCQHFYANTNSDCDLPALPADGEYAVTVEPNGVSTANLMLTLSRSITGNLELNAAPTTFSTTRRGQDARYTFNGQMGKNYSITVSDATIVGASTYAYVYGPSGEYIGSASTASGSAASSFDLPTAVATGKYTVHIDPFQGEPGELKVGVRQAAAGALAIDGAPLVADLLEGQNARYTFNGSVGQRLGLGVTNVSTSPLGGYVSVRVLSPVGAQLIDCGSATTTTACNLPPLPAAGTYAVQVDPVGANLATATLTLSRDISQAITVNAASPTVFTTTRAGQNGSYTFDGTAGTRMAVAWTDMTIPGYWSYLYVYRPDGVLLANQYFGDTMASGVWELGSLPATGTYRLFVDPVGVNVGSARLSVTNALTRTLTVDAAAEAISLRLGRTAEFSFTGAAGQNLGAILSDIVTAPAANTTDPLKLELRGPSGTLLQTCTVGSPYNSSCRFPTLVESGTYQLLLKPGPNTADFGIRIRSTL